MLVNNWVIFMDGLAVMRWITLIAFWIWLIVYWNGGKKVIVDIAESIHSKISRLDTVLLLLISLSSFAFIMISLISSLHIYRMIFSQNPILVFIGMLLTISSIIGMFACRHYLGKFWTAEINLAESHKIIDKGPYRIVRHPIYSFAILMYLGLVMVFLSPWTGLLIGLIVAAYFLKTKDEDVYLQKNLAGYREYASRVRYRLVPGLW